MPPCSHVSAAVKRGRRCWKRRQGDRQHLQPQNSHWSILSPMPILRFILPMWIFLAELAHRHSTFHLSSAMYSFFISACNNVSFRFKMINLWDLSSYVASQEKQVILFWHRKQRSLCSLQKSAAWKNLCHITPNKHILPNMSESFLQKNFLRMLCHFGCVW